MNEIFEPVFANVEGQEAISHHRVDCDFFGDKLNISLLARLSHPNIVGLRHVEAILNDADPQELH